MSVLRPEDQTPEATIEALGSIWPIVYPAMEGAVQQALEFFGDGAIDRPLFPNLVRYHVKVALNSGGLTVVDEDDDQPRLEHSILSNNGLLLAYDHRRIRIRKADHGELPGPGHSETLRRFYQQQLSLIDGVEVEIQKLMLLWDVRGSDVDLRLACPKGGVGHKAWAHWIVAVPHPAETYEAPQTQDDSFEFDVPITLPKAVTDEE
jgi:hypothetical protein